MGGIIFCMGFYSGIFSDPAGSFVCMVFYSGIFSDPVSDPAGSFFCMVFYSGIFSDPAGSFFRSRGIFFLYGFLQRDLFRSRFKHIIFILL